MPNPTIERAGLGLTTSPQTIYTCPADKAAMVQNIFVANKDGAASVDVDIWWTDAADSDAPYYLAKTVPVAADDAIVVVEKTHLKAGDTLAGQASTNGDADVTANILEFDVA